MKAGIVVFPGSNCDRDTRWTLERELGISCDWLWHREPVADGYRLIVLPGGFSYGDYLRTGAIARLSPVMRDVVAHARRGGLVLGICNGFQILTEAGLLPGALLPNRGMRFLCQDVLLRVERRDMPFTRKIDKSVIRLPIAHHGGNYYADGETLRRLEDQGRVLLRYCDAEGRLTAEANPNGSLSHIAGILNEDGNVLGLMPHPERAAHQRLGGSDGLMLLAGIVDAALPAALAG